MPTYITIGVCISIIVVLTARDMLHKRELRGTSFKKRLGHPFEYDWGLIFLHKWLPALPLYKKRQLGSIGALLISLVLVPNVLGLLASFADDSLFLPGDAAGFLEDPIFFPYTIVIATTFYLFRKTMDIVPATLDSIPRGTPDNPSRAQLPSAIRHQLGFVASVLLQAGEQRGRWGRVPDVVLTVLLIGMVTISYASGVYGEQTEALNWRSPAFFWGNMYGIVFFFFMMGYLLRTALAFVIRLIWCMWYIGKKLGDRDGLRIEPLSPDGAGGLGQFGKLAWRIDLLLLPTMSLAVYWYWTWDLTPTYITGFVVLILLVPLFFLLPLWGLHGAMKKAKAQELQLLSQRFDLNASVMRQWLRGKWDVDRQQGLEATAVVERVLLLHQRASHMPVWPFDLTVLARVVGYVLIPLLLILIQRFI